MSKVKITGKVLSIRIGRDSTHIALVSQKGEVLHVAGYDTPVGAVEDGAIRNYEAVLDMLRMAVKEPEFRHVRQAVFCLCTTQVITEVVSVPELANAKLEKLLMANVDMYFPVDMQDYHVVWQVVGTKQQENGQREQQVQLWAVPKSVLVPYYTVANACGLSVAAVDYCGHSIATAVGATYANAAKPAKVNKKQHIEPVIESDGAAYAPQTDMHVTLERDLIGLTFVQNNQVMLQRLIQCGANPSYQFTEVAMMVEYFRSLECGRGSQISIVVSGALANTPAILDELRDVVGLPLGWFNGECASNLILCAGAVKTTMDFGLTTMNSPSKVRNQFSEQLWQYALVLVGGLTLVGAVLITLMSRLAWNAEITNLQNAQQTLTIQAAQTNGFADKYADYERKYASYSTDWETIFTSLKTYNDNLVLLIEELEEIMPEKSSVVNLQIAADGMNVTFACENKEEAAYLIMALRELQYADLLAISNLSGGGKGPATSYGSGNTSVEAPPTEGSARAVDNTLVTKLIFSQLDEEAMVTLVKNMNDEQFAALKNTYGKEPETKATDLSTLKEENTEKLTLQMRQNAIHEMLMNNPFAMDAFADLLTEDFLSQQPILMPYILEDIILLQREGKLDMGAMEDPAKLRGQMEVLISVLTKDDATVTATENLLCTNTELEKTYIHHLEVELGLREKELLPFLKVEKVFTDILSGGFKTGDEALDASLNDVISDETWELINTVTDEEKMGQLVEKYLAEGSTGYELVDSLIKNYLEAGTTGYTKLDEIISKFLQTDSTDEKITQMLVKYLTEGSTGSDEFDKLIENYLNNGTTGNAQMDAAINSYITSGKLDEILSQMLEKYITDGTTGNTVVDSMLEKFLRTGTTGSATLDGVIKGYLENGTFTDKLEGMLTKYLVEGSTGNKLLDELIKKYMDSGKTGNDVLDKLINDYIDEMLKDMDDKKVAELVKKYLADKTTGNDLYDALLKKYFADGTTGIKKLDELIKKYQDSIIGGGSTDDLLDLLDKFFGNGGSTGNGAGTNQIVDTRIFFTAVLGYNEELAMAELERKGLDYESKVDKLEVEE